MWDTIWNVIQALIWGLVILGSVLYGISTYIRWIRSISRLCVRMISIIGLVLMVGGLIFFIFNIPTFHGSPHPPINISHIKVSNLTIIINWWSEQEISSQTTVTVALLPTSSFFPKDEASQTQISSQATPVGTPDTPIIQAFGAHYDVSAQAKLDGGKAFYIPKTDPLPQSTQSLDQPGEVSFRWTVKPLTPGSQFLTLSLIGIWSPKGEGKDIERPLLGYEQLNVKVTEPVPPTPLSGFGLVTLGGALASLVGLIMNLYVVVWVTLKKEKRRKTFHHITGQTTQLTTKVFDVFLCHNGQDKPMVRQIGEELKRCGVSPWLDEWELRPGQPWQRLLEDQISQIKAAAVFVGKDGLGPWQYQELDAFLREFVSRGCPVIPVLLADAPQEPTLPVFLRAMTWVDFRSQDPDPMLQLLWGITGKRTGRRDARREKLLRRVKPVAARLIRILSK